MEFGHVDVLGRRAAYGVGGDGPPVVFLHGWGVAGRTYRAALKRLLALGLKVWAPTLPGFRGSAPLERPPHGLADYARWLDAFCDTVGVEQPATFIGHSFGGGVAIQTAHDVPDRVKGLVLVSALGGGAWRKDGDVVRTMAERPLLHWGLQLPGEVLSLGRPRVVRRVLPFVLDDVLNNGVRNARACWESASMLRNVDLADELHELALRRLPVVVIWGERDALITRASVEAMCKALGDPVMVTVPGNHSWILAAPDEFAAAVERALEVVDPDAAAARVRAQSSAPDDDMALGA